MSQVELQLKGQSGRRLISPEVCREPDVFRGEPKGSWKTHTRSFKRLEVCAKEELAAAAPLPCYISADCHWISTQKPSFTGD